MAHCLDRLIIFHAMNTITLKQFCALHGRSYKGAVASGIPASLIESGQAQRLGDSRNSPLMVDKAAEWPRRTWHRRAKKPKI